MERTARVLRGLPLACLGLLSAVGCQSSSSTMLAFRSPPGSELRFLDDNGQQVATATFPGEVELAQTSTLGEEPKLQFAGRLRVNQLVEEAKIPSAARNYLSDEEGGVSVAVRGYYLVYAYSATPSDTLAVHHVDVDRDILLRILGGEAVALDGKSPGGDLVYKLLFGLDAKQRLAGRRR